MRQEDDGPQCAGGVTEGGGDSWRGRQVEQETGTDGLVP